MTHPVRIALLLNVGLILFFTVAVSAFALTQVELDNYISHKGVNTTGSSQTFGELLEKSFTSVLGLSDETGTDASASSFLNEKTEFTLAVLGDSMVDTLGPGLPHLAHELAIRYPNKQFKLLNYGVGASNIEYGQTRLTNDYTYLGENKPALLAQNPDIVVIESFAYNHWENTQGDLDRQWLTIAKIIDEIKSRSPGTRIILAATIAPHCPTYTDGSANLPEDRKFAECETVKAYLQNLVNFATSQNYPLADAYHASLDGNEGDPIYINEGDNIHPSNEGKTLFAQKVVQSFSQL